VPFLPQILFFRLAAKYVAKRGTTQRSECTNLIRVVAIEIFMFVTVEKAFLGKKVRHFFSG
jgi:hypothetical protein